jgi:hypothetical protein
MAPPQAGQPSESPGSTSDDIISVFKDSSDVTRQPRGSTRIKKGDITDVFQFNPEFPTGKSRVTPKSSLGWHGF